VTSDRAEGNGNGKDERLGPSEFARFEALTRHVIAVPKAEIERREKKYQTRRKRRRALSKARLKRLNP
jgi:U3 small nucleolar ribonucleoprotein component